MPTAMLLCVAALGAVCLSHLAYSEGQSADLLAVWMAGRAFADGDLTQIYPTASGLFTMLPPDGWRAALLAQGYDESVYPFIYPPIWAAVGAVLYRITDFATLVWVASVVNPALLLATLWLALRNAVPRASLPGCFLLGIALFGSGLSALIALEQNQPQILVAFLTVLAIDQQRNGSPLVAGAALAVAASLKVYPALYVLFWLAQGHRRAALAFGLFGAALGATSLMVGGLALHREFLVQLSDISGTVLVTYFTWSIDPTIAQVFLPDRLTQVVDLRTVAADEITTGWWIMQKSALWRIADVALLVATLAALTYLARRTTHILFWPLALTLVSLVSPLSWGYHYLAPLAFAPALIVYRGLRFGALALAGVFVPQMAALHYSDAVLSIWKYVALPAGTLSMVFFAGALALAMRAGARSRAVPPPLARRDPADITPPV